MRRFLAILALVILAVLIGVLATSRATVLLSLKAPIRVGILHSRTGPMAVSENSMVDAELLALEELNANGGLLGRRVEWVIADGSSDWPTFAREAERLIEQEKVSVIFGCGASASRKSVLPVVERHDHLLIYPNAYEGLEQSRNIIYAGSAPNQHIMPAVKWTFDHLRARKYFIAGSDHIWSRAVSAIVADTIQALGAEVVGEEYLLLSESRALPLVAKIKATQPDVILSTVTGNINISFYQELAAAKLGPDRIPVVTFGIAEEELRAFPVEAMVGNYAAWSYFQSIDRPENREFVGKFQTKYPGNRVVSDGIATSYNSVRLWAQAVTEGNTDDVHVVRRLMSHQSYNGPEGIVTIDPDTRHAWRPVYIGKIRADGQFEITWSSAKPIRPVPYPNSRSHEQWQAFVDRLFQSWGGRWSNPASPRALASLPSVLNLTQE
jgi:urea transport system substrate-binding protein